MRPIEKYLNEVKIKTGISTDKDLALALHMSPTIVCYFRKGSTPSDDVCRKLAKLAGDPVEKVLLLAAESRAPESTRAAWEHIFKAAAKAGCFTLTVVAMLSFGVAANAAPLPCNVSAHNYDLHAQSVVRMDIMSNKIKGC